MNTLKNFEVRHIESGEVRIHAGENENSLFPGTCRAELKNLSYIQDNGQRWNPDRRVWAVREA
jgi:hypothetical protein